MEKSEILAQFGERGGWAMGHALDAITGWLLERVPEGRVRINVPYSDFNVRGKVADVHRDVHGVMPLTYLSKHYDEVVEAEDTTTLYYGDTRAGRGNYLPFLSECDVYFVKDFKDGEEMVIDLIKGPSWRAFL